MLNPWLHLTSSKFTISTHAEKVLEQLFILNPHTKLNFSSNNPYFYCILLKNITDKFTIIIDFQVSFYTQDLKKSWVINWMHKIRKESSQKSSIEIFCFNNCSIRKNLLHPQQSDNTKHKPFKFISWPNAIEG